MSPLPRLIDAARSLPTTLGRADTRNYIPELDGLRCLAILFVLVWHASLRAARYVAHVNDAGTAMPSYYGFFPHGEIGVILFFFISGFVVSQPFVGRPIASWRIGDFYKRRFVRIYPPYLIAMTACFVVLGVIGHTPVDANAYKFGTVPLRESFLASLVYLHGIVFDTPSRLNPPMWSLEIEVAFYAVLPLLMLAYCRWPSRGRRVAALCAIIAASVATSSLLLHSLDTDLRLRWGLFYHAYLFLAGVVAADLAGTAVRHEKSAAGDIAFAFGLAVILGIGLMMTQNDARMPGSLYALAIQAATIVAIVLLFEGALRGRLASAGLSLPWVRLIGTMCYSIYLTHIIVMTALSEVLARLVHSHATPAVYAIYLSVLIPAALVAGTIFYVCVERPFARGLVVVKPKAPELGTTGARARPRVPVWATPVRTRSPSLWSERRAGPRSETTKSAR